MALHPSSKTYRIRFIAFYSWDKWLNKSGYYSVFALFLFQGAVVFRAISIASAIIRSVNRIKIQRKIRRFFCIALMYKIDHGASFNNFIPCCCLWPVQMYTGRCFHLNHFSRKIGCRKGNRWIVGY